MLTLDKKKMESLFIKQTKFKYLKFYSRFTESKRNILDM